MFTLLSRKSTYSAKKELYELKMGLKSEKGINSKSELHGW